MLCSSVLLGKRAMTAQEDECLHRHRLELPKFPSGYDKGSI